MYLNAAPEYLYSDCPSLLPWGFSTQKTESKDATNINNVLSTRCLPGQIRFPNPKADDSRGSSRRLPSGLRNRSGLKASGSG